MMSPSRTEESSAMTSPPDYGLGDVLTFTSVFSFLVVPEGGFTIVVLLSFFSAGGFVTVVSFCSQAANRAAPISRHTYFFIQLNRICYQTCGLRDLHRAWTVSKTTRRLINEFHLLRKASLRCAQELKTRPGSDPPGAAQSARSPLAFYFGSSSSFRR